MHIEKLIVERPCAIQAQITNVKIPKSTHRWHLASKIPKDQYKSDQIKMWSNTFEKDWNSFKKYLLNNPLSHFPSKTISKVHFKCSIPEDENSKKFSFFSYH